MEEVRQIASNFEAVKIAMNQDKNGYVLKLSLHPNDAPEDVLRDMVGTRYMVALVRLNDQDEPVASPGTEEGMRAMKIAGTLCSDTEFQDWMVREGYAQDMTETSVAAGMRAILKVGSRKELKHNAEARRRLFDLRSEFVATYRR